jgi:phosphoribosyl-dephospho-CoA transferase
MNQRLPGTHDLLRLRSSVALSTEGLLPAWVEPALVRAPWVVVRRGIVRDGMIPVGVRGSTRSERFAAFLALSEVADRRSPEDLAVLPSRRRGEVPALAALARVAPILEGLGRRWGPGGSVGFEIATGVPTATATSDLDLILVQEQRLPPAEAIALRAVLSEAAAPARVDLLLETPAGGVSLAELAARPAQVLVRTPRGPRLLADPWGIDALALKEGAP